MAWDLASVTLTNNLAVVIRSPKLVQPQFCRGLKTGASESYPTAMGYRIGLEDLRTTISDRVGPTSAGRGVPVECAPSLIKGF